MSLIEVNKEKGVPKYKQIIASIEQGIIEGSTKRGDKLPSINSIRNRFGISRDTVLLAYNELKLRGIVRSVPGKGYYISSESVHIAQKVFLLFDELNSFKEDLYNSFIRALDPNFTVDIYFHHFNFDLFRKLIYDNVDNYASYVIMPANFKDSAEVLRALPEEKVYVLDQMHRDLITYPAIYQNFEKDIFNGLTSGLNYLKKYQELVLLFQEDVQPEGIKKGFLAFCKMNAFNNSLVDEVKEVTVKKGQVYIIPDDKNLIRIIKKIKETNFQLGINIGIISYNDTLLKEVVGNGITTISTDFKGMGKRLAEMLMEKQHLKIENNSKLIIRKSI